VGRQATGEYGKTNDTRHHVLDKEHGQRGRFSFLDSAFIVPVSLSNVSGGLVRSSTICWTQAYTARSLMPRRSRTKSSGLFASIPTGRGIRRESRPRWR